MKVWIDDMRPAPDETWYHFTNSASAIEFLRYSLTPVGSREPREEISFDHDLGGEDTTRPVVIWMIENDFFFAKYNVHSSNPPGCAWLNGMIDRYLQ